MNKEEFLFLLSIRKKILIEADWLIKIGFDINSDRAANLFRISSNIAYHISETLKLGKIVSGYDLLSWALESMDQGETPVVEENGTIRKIENFSDLWNEIERQKHGNI